VSDFHGLNTQYYKDLEEETKSLETTILSGRINDLAEYKRLVGRLSGLNYALDRHKQLIALAENSLYDRS
jgi:hypothetical protein